MKLLVVLVSSLLLVTADLPSEQFNIMGLLQSLNPKLLVKREYSSLDPFVAQVPDPYEENIRRHFDCMHDDPPMGNTNNNMLPMEHSEPSNEGSNGTNFRNNDGPPMGNNNMPPTGNNNMSPMGDYKPPNEGNNGTNFRNNDGPPMGNNNNMPPMGDYRPPNEGNNGANFRNNNGPPQEIRSPNRRPQQSRHRGQNRPPRRPGGPPRNNRPRRPNNNRGNRNGPPRNHMNARPQHDSSGPNNGSPDPGNNNNNNRPRPPRKQNRWRPIFSRIPNAIRKIIRSRPNRNEKIRYGTIENLFPPSTEHNAFGASPNTIFMFQAFKATTPSADNFNRPRTKQNGDYETIKSIEIPVNNILRSTISSQVRSSPYQSQTMQNSHFISQNGHHHLQQSNSQFGWQNLRTQQNNVYRATQSSNGGQQTNSYQALQHARGQQASTNQRQPQEDQNSRFLQQPEIVKHVSIHVAPEEPRPPRRQKPKFVRQQTPEKQVQIIFVKAPSPAAPPQHEIHLPPEPKTRTVVYVMMKKPETNNYQIKIKKPPAAKPSKPEVYFIKYNDKGKQNNQAGITNTNNYDLNSNNYASTSQNNGYERSSDNYGADSNQPMYILPETNTTDGTLEFSRTIYATKNAEPVASDQTDSKFFQPTRSILFESKNTGSLKDTYAMLLQKPKVQEELIIGRKMNPRKEEETQIVTSKPMYRPLDVKVVSESPKFAYRQVSKQKPEYRLSVINEIAEIPNQHYYPAHAQNQQQLEVNHRVQTFYEVPKNSNTQLGKTIGTHYIAPGSKPFTKGSQRIL